MHRGVAKISNATESFDPCRPLPWQAFAGDLRPTVVVLLAHPSKKAFLLVQPKKDKTGTTFMLPQGGINEGESVIEAARRELREEIPSFARTNKRAPYKVAWERWEYAGYQENPVTRSGIPKGVHMVLFPALSAKLTCDDRELQGACWVFDKTHFLALMNSTKRGNPVKYRITTRCIVHALQCEMLR